MNNPSSQIVGILWCVECCLDADFTGIGEVELPNNVRITLVRRPRFVGFRLDRKRHKFIALKLVNGIIDGIGAFSNSSLVYV